MQTFKHVSKVKQGFSTVSILGHPQVLRKRLQTKQPQTSDLTDLSDLSKSIRSQEKIRQTSDQTDSDKTASE